MFVNDVFWFMFHVSIVSLFLYLTRSLSVCMCLWMARYPVKKKTVSRQLLVSLTVANYDSWPKIDKMHNLPIVNYYKNGSIHRLAMRHDVDSEWSHRCIDDNGADDGEDDGDAYRSISYSDLLAYCSISMYWHRAEDHFAQNQNAFVDWNQI